MTQKFNLVVLFYTFRTIDFDKLKKFDIFVIKYVPTDPLIHVSHGDYCNLAHGKLFYHRITNLQYIW